MTEKTARVIITHPGTVWGDDDDKWAFQSIAEMTPETAALVIEKGLGVAADAPVSKPLPKVKV